MTGRVPRHICPRRNLLLFRLTTFVVSGCSSCFGFSWRSNESCDCCFFVCFCLVGVLFVVAVVVAVSVVASVIGVVFVVDSIKAGANDEDRIVTGVSALIVIADVVFELDVVLLRVVVFELTATAVVVVAVVVGVDVVVVNFVIVGADLLLDIVVS